MSEPYEKQDLNEKGTRNIRSSAGSDKSDYTRDAQLEIEESSFQGPDEIQPKQEPVSRPSQDLKKVASNVLTKVASRLTTHSIVNPPPAPDGGVHAWTQVAMGWLVLFTTWGWVNSYGAFQSYYTLTLGLPPSTISWIGAVQNFLTFFVGAFSGRALDAGYLLPALMAGFVIQLLGVFFMSLSTKYWQLMLTQGIMTGLGGGLFFTPSLGVMGTYFSSKRALAIGIATTGNSVGGMIYPVLVQQLLPKLGFAWTARVLGFLNLGLLSIVLVFMRPRLPPRSSGPIVDLSAFKEPTYAFLVAGLFFVIWAVYWTVYYLSSYGIQVVGMPFETAIDITIILNGAGLPARVIPPFFASRFGQLNTLVPILFALAIVAFSWIAVHTPAGIYTYTVFYGIWSAAFQCLMPSTIASITPNMNMFGTRLGMAFSTLSFAALTGPSLGGALQSAMGGRYFGAQLWAAIATAISMSLVLASRMAKARWKIHSKC